MADRVPFEVVRSGMDGRVRLRGTLSTSNYYGDNASISAKFSADLTTDEARALAVSLVAVADAADASVAKRAAAEARRKAWRERETAAGRIKVMSAKEFFG